MMERLTKRENGHTHYPRCFEEPCGGIGCRTEDCEFKVEICERLAAYEDTGLMPENVEALKLSVMGKAIAEIKEFNGLPVNRLRELAEADRDGRVVVLPCKVGDTVYRLFAGNPDNPVIATLKINTVAEAVKLIGKMGMHKYIGTFLTREEAEKALEAMKDGNC